MVSFQLLILLDHLRSQREMVVSNLEDEDYEKGVAETGALSGREAPGVVHGLEMAMAS